MAGVREVSSESDYKAILASLAPGALVTIFFHTPWAGPCKQMRTFFDALASQYDTLSNRHAFLAIDAEDLPEISEAFDVTAVPFFVLTRDGRTIESISGSNSGRVRDAVERESGSAAAAAASRGANGSQIPDKLSTTPQARSNGGGLAGGTAAAGQTLDKGDAVANGANGSIGDGHAATNGGTETSQEDMNTRLAGLVKAASVMLFMKGTPSAPQCGFSRQIVAILRERGVRYGFFNILADEEVRQGMKTFADWPTFPQLWVGGELVGGLDIVKEEIENDPDFFAEYSVSKPAVPASETQNSPQTAVA